jgi:CRISPR-associated protein Cmr1
MKSITFTCETLTPMFLNGADGATPELRPPAIKAALRFWWRALNGHLGLKQMKEQEAKIFGGSGENETGRSKLTIRIIPSANPLRIEERPLLPHRVEEPRYGNPSMAKAIIEGQTFQVKIGVLDNDILDVDKTKALFQLAVVLGGLGKRVRRGMGSIKITAINEDGKDLQSYKPISSLDEIQETIKHISSHFLKQGDAINNTYNGRMEMYPYIKQIQIGKTIQRNYKTILIQTGKTASDLLKKNGEKYEASLGHANRDSRFASPLYVTVIENENSYVTLVTTLNAAPPKTRNFTSTEIQKQFKSSVLA